MRRSYERGELDEQDAGTAPLALFQRWFEQARAQGSGEANAMTLATVGPQGRPSTRVVLAKDVDQRGITWLCGDAQAPIRESRGRSAK